MAELILWCVPESRAVARIIGPAGGRVNKDSLVDALEMVVESHHEEKVRVLKSAKNGSELLCPYCGNRLALAREGQSRADIAAKPIHLPLGSFRLPS